MKRATGKANYVMREPFIAARARYATLVRGVRKFARIRVKMLDKELAALELSAREGTVAYLRLAVKELRLLEKELGRIEKKVAPPPRRTRRAHAPKAAIRAVPAGLAV